MEVSRDARILTEYGEVLDRPTFDFEKDKLSALLDHIEHRGLTVAASPLSQSLSDIDDGGNLGDVACYLSIIYLPRLFPELTALF